MGKYRMARSVLLLLGAGVCVRGAVWVVGVVYAACPAAAALLLLGGVCVLMMAVGNWRDTDEAERYYMEREARWWSIVTGRRAR